MGLAISFAKGVIDPAKVVRLTERRLGCRLLVATEAMVCGDAEGAALSAMPGGTGRSSK
jgi:hypothetical protein